MILFVKRSEPVASLGGEDWNRLCQDSKAHWREEAEAQYVEPSVYREDSRPGNGVTLYATALHQATLNFLVYVDSTGYLNISLIVIIFCFNLC